LRIRHLAEEHSLGKSRSPRFAMRSGISPSGAQPRLRRDAMILPVCAPRPLLAYAVLTKSDPANCKTGGGPPDQQRMQAGSRHDGPGFLTIFAPDPEADQIPVFCRKYLPPKGLPLRQNVTIRALPELNRPCH